MKLNERLGIPEGISQEANSLYKKILISLDKLKSNKLTIPRLDQESEDFEIVLARYDIKIKDLKLKRIPFVLFICYHPDVEKPTLMSAAYGSKETKYSYLNDQITSEDDVSSSNLSLRIAVSKDQSKQSIIESIKSDLEPDTISHELMHIYDHYKNKKRPIEQMADYASYRTGGFPELISKFLYLLYYSTSIENTVRPTELYQQMLNKGVTKENFKDFIKENDVIKTLTKAEKFSLVDFKEKLNQDNEVDEFIKSAVNGGYKRIGSNADDALNLIMINLLNNKFNALRSILNRYVRSSVSDAQMFISMLTGIPNSDIIESEKKATVVYNSIVSKYKKYENNHNKYFEYLEKKFNFVGEKMKRKLFKLYDMIEDKKSNKSILNWDLHNKINSKKSKNEGFVLDFSTFKFSNK